MMDINELLFIGTNKYGQAGIGEKYHNKTFGTPKSFAFSTFIKQISCGSHHSALLTIDGNIYTMGSNIHGALGSNPTLNYSFTPTLVEGLRETTKINCGPFHMCAIADGALYSWGKGIDGQLGHGNTKNMPKPTLVEALGNEVEDVSCGTNHTIVSVRKEQSSMCYAFGNGIYGQLGTGQSRNSYTPVRVKLEGVEAFAAGENHSLFVVEGKVYACGDNSSGQLGTLFHKKFSSQPARVELPQDEIFISVFAKKYSVALTDRGEIYVWGLKPGFGTPKKLKGVQGQLCEMIQVRIGSEKCYSLESKGVLYEWDVMKGREVEGAWVCNHQKLVSNNRAILDFSAGEGYLLILGDIVRQIEYNSIAGHNLSYFEDLQSVNNSLRLDQISLCRDKPNNYIAQSQLINEQMGADMNYQNSNSQMHQQSRSAKIQNKVTENTFRQKQQQEVSRSHGLQEINDFNNRVCITKSKIGQENLKEITLKLNEQLQAMPREIIPPQNETFDLMQSQSSSIQCQPSNFLKQSLRNHNESNNRSIRISDSILQSEFQNIEPEAMKKQKKAFDMQDKQNLMSANFQKKDKHKKIDRVMEMLEKSHSISQKSTLNSNLRQEQSEQSDSRLNQTEIIKTNRLLRVEVREKQLKISQLQELLSRKEMEIQAQREVIKLLREKNNSNFVSLERN